MPERGSDRARTSSFLEKTNLDGVVTNLAKDVLKSKGISGDGVDKFMETDESIVLMDILEKMVEKWGPKLKIVKSSDHVYPLEAFSGNRNSYVNNKGSVVFEVDGYAFLQREIVELQGINYMETDESLAESPYRTEAEKSVLRTGFRVSDENEIRETLGEYSFVLSLRMEDKGYAEFQRVYVKNGSLLGKVEVWKNSNGEGYHVDYVFEYKKARGTLGGFDGETIDEVVKKAVKSMKERVEKIDMAEDVERLGELDLELEELDDESLEEEVLSPDEEELSSDEEELSLDDEELPEDAEKNV